MTDSLELDYYAIVGVSNTADTNEIRTAYRKASLKVHPDRNPNDPSAAEKFHLLNTAFEILLDPIKRATIDAKRAIQIARATRFSGLDSKRKAMTRDLELREEAYQKQQSESLNSNLKKQKLADLKAAGVKLREAKAAQRFNESDPLSPPMASTSQTKSSGPDEVQPIPIIPMPSSSSNSTNSIDTLLCTLRFRWSRKKKPELNSSQSLETLITSSEGFSSSDIESIVMSPSQASHGMSDSDLQIKKLSALVCFKSIKICERFFEHTQISPFWTNCNITIMKLNPSAH